MEQTLPSTLSFILQAAISEGSHSSLPLQLYQAPTCKQNSHTLSRREPENNTAWGLHILYKEKYLPFPGAQSFRFGYESKISHHTHSQ